MDRPTDAAIMADKTSIQVSDDIADWLHALKERGESYDDVLRRIRDERDGGDA